MRFTPYFLLLVLVIFLASGWVTAQGFPDEPCDCLDLLFLIDDTADMADVVAHLQVAFGQAIGPLAQSLCGDARFGVISFKDDVSVDLALTSSWVACQNALNSIVVSGGGNTPEASDQALLEAFDMESSACTIPPGFDPGTWRPECCKIAVLMTSSLPAGCDDTANPSDRDNGLAQSLLASAMDIMIVAIYETDTGWDPEVADLMARYAANSEGLYGESNQGMGIGSIIGEGLYKCIQGTSETEFCCVQDENAYCVEAIVGLCNSLGGDVTANCGLCLMSDAGLSTPFFSDYSLHQCKPNPFNPKTTISFELPGRETVTLQIFDMAGRLVRNLITSASHASGRHEVVWNGRDEADRQVASGTYFYRLEAGSYSETKRMVLVK